MTEDATYERSEYEAKMDIAYYARLHVLHERLFSRMDKLGKLLELVAGSGAFYAVTAGHDGATKACALLIAVIALAGLVFDPAGRARGMRDAMRNYMLLLSDAEDLPLVEIDKRLARMGADAPTVLEGLRRPAYNQNLVSHGRASYTLPLTKWERFLQAIA